MSLDLAHFSPQDAPEIVRESLACRSCSATPYMVMLDRPQDSLVATSCCASCRSTSKFALAEPQFSALWTRPTLPGTYLHFAEAVR